MCSLHVYFYVMLSVSHIPSEVFLFIFILHEDVFYRLLSVSCEGGGDIDPYSEVLRHSFTSSSTYLFCNPGISMYPCGYFSSTSNVVFMYGPIIPMYVRYLSTLPLKAWHWILLNCGPKSIYLSLAFLSEQRRYLTHSILAISTPNHSLATVKPSSSSTSTLK